IRQILLNLLSNAAKFTPDGGRIDVRVCLDRNGDFLLSVADTGIGIAKEHMRAALTPFEQIGSAMVREHDGTGLGLPLVKSLAELHGGGLLIESEVGAGTTVTVRFPAKRVYSWR
ncbi:MAG: ATP-binding protein, partial [Alphaproteobacteria bacterium]